MDIYTIGFTKKSASEFFEALRQARIERLVDIRLSNTSQLAGFTKRDDLSYFLDQLCGASYVHEPRLAPSPELFHWYKKEGGAWPEYERRFLNLMRERRIENVLDHESLRERTVLLCTEPTPERCHRRLVAEYLREKWSDVDIVHL